MQKNQQKLHVSPLKVMLRGHSLGSARVDCAQRCKARPAWSHSNIIEAT